MYDFIDCHRGRYTVGMMARALRISPRSYYDYRKGIARRDDLERRIRSIYARSKGSYGAPRIAADIRADGYQVSANTISKYMKRMGLRSKLSRKWRNVNYPEYTLRICPNHLDRQFNPDAPGKVWVSDIT